MMLVGQSGAARNHWAVLSSQAQRTVHGRRALSASLLRDAVTAMLLLGVSAVLLWNLGSLASARPADALSFRFCLYGGLGFATRFAWRLARRPQRPAPLNCVRG